VKEEGAKGASLVMVRGLQVAAPPEHVAFDVIRWQRLTVDLTGAATLDAVQDRTRFALDEAMLVAEGRMLIVRVTLVGECAMHADLARAPERLREEMRAAALDVAGADQLWIEDVRVATRPALDVAAMRAQPGPVGALIQALDKPVTLDPQLQEFVADQAKRAGIGLDPDHPATAIGAGRLPDDLVARARALLLAELAAG
jgi:exonuclease SbcD